MNITDATSTDISIEVAASLVNVSTATIRNWIKLGYIETTEKKLIKRASLDSFVANVIGKKKLNSRANKLYKQPAQDAIEYNIEDWQNYEASLTESHRNKEGIYYTPIDIVNDICSRIEKCDFSNKTFLDPCCGSGNFLIAALQLGFSPQNIYGFDTDKNAVEITQKRIEEATGYKSENIKCLDFLSVADSIDIKFDYIFTNPPWGKKMNKSLRSELALRYDAGKSHDSCSIFLYASLRLLRKGGQIGFLLPEAFFNIGTFEDIRRCLLGYKIDYLIDYGRAFKPLLTKAQAFIATNTAENKGPILCQYGNLTYNRDQSSFKCNPQLIYNINASDEDSEVVEHILNLKYTTLKGCAKWGLGIVTGDNKRFCSDKYQKGFKAIYRGSDITPFGFKEPSLYIDEDLSLYQQVAPAEMYNSHCKLVYKFISSKLCFVCDTEQRFVLNSANFLILDNDYPIPPDELASLLNSDFMNWLFQKIFSTHKILRGNLEALPIFIDGFEDGIFCEDKYLNYLNIEKTKNGSFKVKR